MKHSTETSLILSKEELAKAILLYLQSTAHLEFKDICTTRITAHINAADDQLQSLCFHVISKETEL